MKNKYNLKWHAIMPEPIKHGRLGCVVYDLRLQSKVKQDVIAACNLLSVHARHVTTAACHACEPSGMDRLPCKVITSKLASNVGTSMHAHQAQHFVRGQHILTVPRSPFVFKKTREQFALRNYVCKFECYVAAEQQAFFLRSLALLRLPCELKIACRG